MTGSKSLLWRQRPAKTMPSWPWRADCRGFNVSNTWMTGTSPVMTPSDAPSSGGPAAAVNVKAGRIALFGFWRATWEASGGGRKIFLFFCP
jgi:hypothetical protein